MRLIDVQEGWICFQMSEIQGISTSWPNLDSRWFQPSKFRIQG